MNQQIESKKNGVVNTFITYIINYIDKNFLEGKENLYSANIMTTYLRIYLKILLILLSSLHYIIRSFNFWNQSENFSRSIIFEAFQETFIV